MAERMIFHKFHIYMVMCAFGYAFSKPIKKCSPLRKTCMKRIFEFGLYNVIADVSHSQIGLKNLCGILYIGRALKMPYLVAWNDLEGKVFAMAVLVYEVAPHLC